MPTKRILLTILSLSLLVAPVLADITILGDKLQVDTAAYTVLFGRGTITHVHNKRTGETYTAPLDDTPGLGKQTAVLSSIQHFWARWDAEIQIEKIDARQAEIMFRRGGNEIRLSIAIAPNNNDLLIGGEGVSEASNVDGMQWCIDNLDVQNLSVIIPSQNVQVIDASSGIDYRNFPYPSYNWEAQLAIVRSERGGFYVR